MRFSSLNSRAVVHFTNKNFFLVGLILSFLLFVQPCGVWAANYYVNPDTGVDIPENGTSKDPWKTITYAVANVEAGTKTVPNVITVALGTYDSTENGETFPINFTRDFVHLIGAGAKSTIVDAESAAVAMNINAKGISIAGFTFSNAADAIDISEGGFTISNNTFLSTIGDGVSLVRSETNYAADITFPDMKISNNTFRTSQNGVYVYVEIGFDNGSRTARFGNLKISDNTFLLTNGDGIYISSLFDLSDITGGTVSASNLTISGNTVTGGDNGIFFLSEVTNISNTQVTIGDILVSGNTCTNQTAYGIYIDYWNLGYLSGTSSAVLGNLTVSDNTVQATDYTTYAATYGIYIYDLGHLQYITDQTTITIGTVNLSNNTIDVNRFGMYLESNSISSIGDQTDDSVSVTTGSQSVTGNTINSNNSWGLYFYITAIGSTVYGSSSINFGSFNIISNTITSKFDPIYFYEDYSGYELYDAASVSMGAVSIRENTLSATSDNGIEFYFDYLSYSLAGNSSFTMSPVTIDNNTITSAGEGIYISYFSYEVGADMSGNATGTLPDWIIKNNTIDVKNGAEGVEFYSYGNPYENSGSSSLYFGSMLIDNNTFNPNKDGGMTYGVYFDLDELVEAGYDSSKTILGDVIITNNKVFAVETEGIYVLYGGAGYHFIDSPSLTMGEIEIGKNTIDTAPTGIDVLFDPLFTEAGAKVGMGGLDIHDNILTNISSYGIYADYSCSNAAPATATLKVGAPNISGNMVSGKPASLYGVLLKVVNSTDGITFGMPTINRNTVSGFSFGMYLEDLPEAMLSCNYLENNSTGGILFDTNGTNFVFNTNSLVGNSEGLIISGSKTAVINAERNWWGDKAGPIACGSCNGVDPGTSGTVDYTPWLTYQPEKSRCGLPFPWLMFAPAITGMGR